MANQPILGAFDFQKEIDRFPIDVPSGRRSEILVKTPSLRVVLVMMRAGTESHEHSVAGPITIQALEGVFAVTVEGQEHSVSAGSLVALEGGAAHAVRAIEDGAFLLTISWLGGQSE